MKLFAYRDMQLIANLWALRSVLRLSYLICKDISRRMATQCNVKASNFVLGALLRHSCQGNHKKARRKKMFSLKRNEIKSFDGTV